MQEASDPSWVHMEGLRSASPRFSCPYTQVLGNKLQYQSSNLASKFLVREKYFNIHQCSANFYFPTSKVSNGPNWRSFKFRQDIWDRLLAQNVSKFGEIFEEALKSWKWKSPFLLKSLVSLVSSGWFKEVQPFTVLQDLNIDLMKEWIQNTKRKTFCVRCVPYILASQNLKEQGK